MGSKYARAFSRYSLLWLACIVLLAFRFYVSEASISHFDKILLSLLIFTIALTASDLLVTLTVEKFDRGPMDLPTTTLSMNLIRFTILTLAALMILSVLGVAIAPLLTALGVGSLAVALGLHETLSNFFAGIYILKSQIIQIGDFIRLDSGQEGYVVDVGLRAVHLKSLSNTMIYVPTSKISQNIITNFSHPTPDFTTPVEVQVDSDSDLEKVEKITLKTAAEAARKLDLVTDEPQATVRFHGFGDSGIQFTVYLRAREIDSRLLLVHEFLKELSRKFAEHEIKFSIPHRIVHLQEK